MSEQKESGRLAALVGEKLNKSEATQKVTAWDVFRECGSQVNAAKRKGVSWEQIAQSIQSGAKEVYGVEIRLSARTASDYYYRLTHRNKKKRRKPSSTVASNTPSTTAQRVDIEGESPPQPETVPEEDTPEKEEPPTQGRSSQRQPKKTTRFNQSSRPGAKSINIL